MNNIKKIIVLIIFISVFFSIGSVSSYKFYNVFVMKQCLKSELKLIENCNRWYERLQR